MWYTNVGKSYFHPVPVFIYSLEKAATADSALIINGSHLLDYLNAGLLLLGKSL